ncbi:STAS domain-containing protein [Actinomadura sp. ATCC 31491]|uniref:Anti-sigma factor antagonist n=1 Tax=Actinomadura luzonensis TaxID=2805427 RepID=A0ABT0FSZ0_9ACTN|nr:STAS domain-containing protein [Actinomadura luzonensis]MCK2215384.1 STAS domain-containing protein [Actinomadura luzonensis]
MARRGRVIVVFAAGELDYQVADVLHRRVSDAWARTPTNGLVLDLSGLSFCDSRCVGVLVGLLQQSRRQGCGLVLCGLPARLERRLTILGLRAVFQVEPSVERAVEAVSGFSPQDA